MTQPSGPLAKPAAQAVATPAPAAKAAPEPVRQSKSRAVVDAKSGAARAAERQPWKDALLALGLVLDRHASSRQVFRYLTALEAAVAQRGPKALGRLPTPVLELALEQMEGLVRDWSVPALAFLRSAVSVEITTRRKVSAAKEQELSVFVAPNKLHVNEDSESAFMEFQRHWAAANNEASGRPRRAA